MDLTLAAVCDEAREGQGGKLDIFGIYSELTAPGFPAVQPRMTLVLVMEWDADEAGPQPFRADLVFETGQRVLTIEGETEVGPPTLGRPAPRTRLVMPLKDVVFPAAGRYRFEVVAGGDTHTACSLFLSDQPQPARSTGHE